MSETENCCCREEGRKTLRSEEEKRSLTTRINRIVGQMNGIKRMVEEDRYCEDIIIQLSAVEKSVRSLASLMLERHMHGCLTESVKNGNTQVIDEIVGLFKRFE